MVRTTRSALAVLALASFALAACSDATTSPRTNPGAGSPALASGGGSGGGAGGGGGAIPQLAGNWRGSYHYEVAFGGPVDITHDAWMTLNEDRSGNLWGSFCLTEKPSPGCFSLKGRAQNDGSIQIEVAMDATFRMNGAITGTVACGDGSTGLVMSGKFAVREAFGTFTFNNCPAASG